MDCPAAGRVPRARVPARRRRTVQRGLRPSLHLVTDLHKVHVEHIEYVVKKGADSQEAVLVVDGIERLRFATVRCIHNFAF